MFSLSTWLVVLGCTAIAALWIGRRGLHRHESVIPLILRRRELQEHLASLVPEDEARRMVLAESSRQGHAPWDIEVLERCIARVLDERALCQSKGPVEPAIAAQPPKHTSGKEH